jgi:hypothetical protein
MDMALMVLAAIYFAPFMIAAGRLPEMVIPILVLNLLIGWTGVGWLALVALAVLTPAGDATLRR